MNLGHTDTITLERVHDLVEMMKKRGLSISHTTIMRWVHQYDPELDKRIRRHLKQTNKQMTLGESMKHISK
ncbi:hypothetical protein AT269_17825 [Bacillus cereus]|nr:hypothetical protein AT269_17825 [Bacillus cereus]